ncbi:MAG: hypothetical protein ABIP39_10680 [Polyangiaceae bacterium]
MIAATEKVGIATLEDTPRRALEFIRGIGASPEVMRALVTAGYTTNDHEEGIRLVNDVLGYISRPSAIAQPSAPSYAAAVKEIKQWVKSDFRRIKIGLHRFFPEQAEYLFTGLDVSGVMDAVALVEIFLKRLGSLANAPERKATRKADHAAIAMLETRRVTKANLKHLHALVTETHATPTVPPVEATTGATDGRVEALVALRAWYADWAETARIVLTRRDYLIRVGLATRKPRTAAMPVIGAPPVPPGPPAAPSEPAMLALPMSTSTRAA